MAWFLPEQSPRAFTANRDIGGGKGREVGTVRLNKAVIRGPSQGSSKAGANASCNNGSVLCETWRSLPCLLALGACSGAHDKATPAPPPLPSPVSVVLGTPGGDDGITFVPFEPGQVLQLQTFGQGGTHVLLAARTQGFGIRAFAAFTLTDLNTGNQLTAP